MKSGAPVPPGACLNCQTPLAGHYCSHCGQPADVHVPSTHELLHEVLEGVTHSDSRLWRTLKDLWFRPGVLTLEYTRGRRVAYLPPFRLYLVISVVFFLLAAHAGTGLQLIRIDTDSGHTEIDSNQTLSEADCQDFDWLKDSHPDWHERLQHGCLAAIRDSGQSWREQSFSLLPKAMFLLVPLVALLHMLMYWRPRHRYAEQLVFFLHLHAFFFSAQILSLLLHRLPWPLPARLLSPLLACSIPVYLFIALRRVFANGWALTALKGMALLIMYAILISATLSAVFIYSALQL